MAIVLSLAPCSRKGTLPHDQQRPRPGTVFPPVAMAPLAGAWPVWPVLTGASPPGRPHLTLNQLTSIGVQSQPDLNRTFNVLSTAVCHNGYGEGDGTSSRRPSENTGLFTSICTSRL